MRIENDGNVLCKIKQVHLLNEMENKETKMELLHTIHIPLKSIVLRGK